MEAATGFQEIWDDTLNIVKAELNTPTFKTWFEHARPLGLVDDTLVVSVHNDFAKDWIESRYSGLLRSALEQVTGNNVGLSFTVETEEDKRPEQAESAGEAASLVMPDLEAAELQRVKQATDGEFNPKYTFDSFVMGSSNRFAYAVSQAVAENPGKAYNPLFIYGGVGLGKTHLLQAIAQYVHAHYRHLKVRYVSSEQFTNDFIQAIGDRQKKTEGFRRQYRNNDVLLVDDIQFLAGKEGTQEEFFNTFNSLQQAGKQIVLSSDRPPKEIATLEERLRSRFEGGLIADIQPPDLETRIAILRRKVESEGLVVDHDVLSFVADKISSNVRELEGALIRITAFSSLTRHPIDIGLAESVLKDIFPERSVKPISVGTIQGEVCRYYGISKAELIGNKRSQVIVYPRQIAMYLSRELTDLSLPAIGQEFGGRDHTTVMHAKDKIQKLMNEQREVYNQIQGLTNLIKQKN